MTLMGDHALNYVRSRNNLEDSTNEHRMIRQAQYMEAFYAQGKECAENNDSFVLDAVTRMNERIGGVNMPNIKSSKKDVIRSKVAYEKNKADKSEMKTIIKKFEAALAAGDRSVAETAYKQAVVSVDKAVNKGILHKNTAARKKSSMTLRLNKLA